MNNRLLGELPARTEAVQDFRWFEDQFGGLLRMQFDIKGDLLDATNFEAVQGLVAALIEDQSPTSKAIPSISAPSPILSRVPRTCLSPRKSCAASADCPRMFCKTTSRRAG